jgi:hypothetical protein
LVAVKLFHRSEVSISDANYDHGERVIRASNNLVNGLSQIVDHTISDD